MFIAGKLFARVETRTYILLYNTYLHNIIIYYMPTDEKFTRVLTMYHVWCII